MELKFDNIYQGDCLELMKFIPDNSIDAVICDLPYGTTACAWDSVIPFDKLWEQYRRICKPNAPIVLFGSEPFSSYLRLSNIKWYRYDWVWEKTKASGFLDANRKPLKIHETISVFSEKSHLYNPQGLIKGIYKTGRDVNMDGKVYRAYKNHEASEYGNYPKSVLHYANPSGVGHLHPTQKPVDLLRYLVLTYTNEGDVVLDNCSGSGSTAVACWKEKRHFICIEKDPVYYEKSVNRIKTEMAQLRLF